MNSMIFNGFVKHERLKPQPHAFHYKIYVYGIFLDELEALHERLPLFGHNRFRPASIHDGDYLHEGPGSIRAKLFPFLQRKGCGASVSRILLITSARYWGKVFNPVSFYYCFREDGEVECVVAEVNNTFGERHLYVLCESERVANGEKLHYRAPKDFHVSPFNNVAGDYDFLFTPRVDKELDVRIELRRDGDLILRAQLWGQALPLNSRIHARTLLRHPLVPRLTMPRILWEAARLHFKKNLHVHTKPRPRSFMTIRRIPPTSFQRKCMKAVKDILGRMDRGQLHMVLPDGENLTLGTCRKALSKGRTAHLQVNDHRFFSRVALHGDIGLGDAYMLGDWDSDDPTAVLELLIENREQLQDGNILFSSLSRALQTLQHRCRRNSVFRSRKNIGRHYDLSNDFFTVFLDSSMTYSSALYRDGGETLEQAQKNKMWAIMEKARIGKEDHVLEIGCGWGGFAIEAVKKTGCRVTGITVSENQYRMASRRVKEEGLEDRITVLSEDYRHVTGQYDKIVSIEMLEAVGHEYLGTFFRCCDKLLKRNGLVVFQVITIPDQRYEAYRRTCDWTQKHIFPGGMLPSILALSQAAAKHSSLVMEELENIGIHYARTLAQWRQRFLQNEEKVAQLGFDEEFRRKWLYYFSYCEAAFSTRTLGDHQIVFTRPCNEALPNWKRM